jgi:hypothetical protein
MTENNQKKMGTKTANEERNDQRPSLPLAFYWPLVLLPSCTPTLR